MHLFHDSSASITVPSVDSWPLAMSFIEKAHLDAGATYYGVIVRPVIEAYVESRFDIDVR